MTERSEMEAALEAILFVSSEPVPRDQADGAVRGGGARAGRPRPWRPCSPATTATAAGAASWWRTWRAACAWRPGPEVVGWLRRFFDVAGGNKLSMAALETLAIIAYRQPMTGPEIQELRGVSAAGVLKTLLERRLVRIVGRKEVVGKPFLYGTTREFLVHFGLNSLKDLPPLEEFEETFGCGDASGRGGPRRDGGAAARRRWRARLDDGRAGEGETAARTARSVPARGGRAGGAAGRDARRYGGGRRHERGATAEDPGAGRHRLPPQGRGADRGGAVTVNGQVAGLGDKADPERDSIKVDGKRVQPPPASTATSCSTSPRG